VRELPLYPTLYEVNTRVTLAEIRPGATLDDLPDAFLDRLAGLGVDLVWMLGVWQTGPAGRAVSRSQADWRQEFLAELPDLREEDITGSPFAVQAYRTHRDFGGDAALARLRERLHRRGLQLMLDLVPNHTAPDHAWVRSHPEFYVHGSAAELEREPQNYCRVETERGPAVLAHGKDPYFAGWPDTLQLNYRHPGFRAAMIDEMLAIADRCDGVRCDMAMLVLPEVIGRTWGDRSRPADGAAAVDASFWPEAIGRVRARHRGFLFLAEVYWDLEWELLQQGFDWTYDKRLYDRLAAGETAGVRAHLGAGLDFQRRCARFLENHDEPRAAAVFPFARHRAAALIAFLTPGLRFLHDGQLEGRRVCLSMHLGRRRAEAVDAEVQDFYARLLECLRRAGPRAGQWRLCPCRPAWEGNPTSEAFVAFTWDEKEGPPLLAAVNAGPTRGQCYAGLPWAELAGKRVVLRDLLSAARYERDGSDLVAHGLYLDVPAWGSHLFEVLAA
jgi:glycosidase